MVIWVLSKTNFRDSKWILRVIFDIISPLRFNMNILRKLHISQRRSWNGVIIIIWWTILIWILPWCWKEIFLLIMILRVVLKGIVHVGRCIGLLGWRVQRCITVKADKCVCHFWYYSLVTIVMLRIVIVINLQ